MTKLQPYESYKEVDLTWIDRIPEHWELRKIKFIFNERNERNHPKLPHLAATQSHGVILKDDYETRTVVAMKNFETLKLVKKGDFVISLRSFEGGIEFSWETGIISPAYTIMVPLQDIDSDYFRHLAKSSKFIELLNLCVTGIREGQNINYQELKNSYMPLPTLLKQTQIAAYLDQKTQQIDKYIQLKQQQIELLEEQKTAIINQAVTKGLDPSVPLKDSGVEWLGEIPEHWDIRFLFQVAEEQKVSNQHIQHQNLLSLSYGNIIRRDIETTDGLLPASFDNYQVVYDGNIILRLTDLQNDQKSLRVGLVKETGIITSAYVCLKFRINAIPEYYYYLLHSLDTTKVFYGMGGGVRQSLNYKGINKIELTAPSKLEQQQIVDYLDQQTGKIDTLISQTKEKIKTMEEFRTSLISSVVTGELDVREVTLD